MPVFLAGVALGLCSIFCLSLLARALSRRFSRGTGSLRGPLSPSWLFGATKILAKSSEAGPLYEQWAEEYGSAFNVPCEFGRSCLVLCDPKAIQHFYIRETRAYVHTSLIRTFTERLVGRCLFWAEGETHRRQRKALAPAFSPTAVKELLPVFSATAHKVAVAWDALLAENDSTEVDIRDWMTRLAYDAFGSASLGRDFGTLCGKHSDVVEAVDSIRNLQAGSAAALQISLSLVFPVALRIPTTFQCLHEKLDAGLKGIVDEVCRAAPLKDTSGISDVVDLLLKMDKSDSQSSMSLEEVHSQLKLLLLTGYVTTSNCLTWCLLECCRRPEVQRKLRDEVSLSRSAHPTWEQLTNGLPYLDAVVHETLRLHPPLGSTTRVAAQDDVIPLSSPVRTASGTLVDQVLVSKGQLVTVPIYAMNTSHRLWGADAKEFNPDRFLDGARVPKQMPGHRHILTFAHGQRMCPGKHYALAELKVVLYVLIRNFAFELPDGPGSKVDVLGDVLSVPGVPGENGSRVPLRVRRLG